MMIESSFLLRLRSEVVLDPVDIVIDAVQFDAIIRAQTYDEEDDADE